MNFLVLKYDKILSIFENIESKNLGWYFSTSLHLLILLTAIGLPNIFYQKNIVLPNIIPIEIINVTDFTSVPKEIKNTKTVETKKIKIKEKKFNSSNNQDIKKIDIKNKSKIKDMELKPKTEIKESIFEEKKELLKDLKEVKVKKEADKIESLPSKKIKPKLKPKSSLLDSKKILKKDVVVKLKPKQVDEFNIASMLKDLRNEKISKKNTDNNNDDDKELLDNNTNDLNEDMAQLSISEIDLVLLQLSRCFIVPAGAEIKKTTYVKISAKIQRNRRIYEDSIRIVDTNIAINNPFYGPITRSSMNTFFFFFCIPLKLPEDKYDLWKNITLTFDYSVMKGG